MPLGLDLYLLDCRPKLLCGIFHLESIAGYQFYPLGECNTKLCYDAKRENAIMADNFQAGESVQLKCGGPWMTIESLDVEHQGSTTGFYMVPERSMWD